MNLNINRDLLKDGVKLAAVAALGFGLSLLAPDFSVALRMKLIDYTTQEATDEEKLEMNGCDIFHAKVHPSDLDLNDHMNNAKFVKDLNFTRRRFMIRFGITRILQKEGKTMVVQAQTIRYRKELKRGDEFSITTEIMAVSDSENSFFVVSKFCNPLGFVLAIHHCKYRIISNKNGAGKGSLPSEILRAVGLGNVPSADIEGNVPFIDAWNDANTVSSQELHPRSKGSPKHSRRLSANNKKESVRRNSENRARRDSADGTPSNPA